MRLSICCLILITSICFNSHSQSLLKRSKTFNQVPGALIRKAHSLAKKDTTDTDRFYRICEWICQKKKNDIKAYQKIELYNKKSLTKIWRDKTLRPIEYSRLLEAMCKEVNIQCHIVEGYGEDRLYNQGKAFYYHNHQWNIAQIGNEFLIVDLTFASGFSVPKISLWGKIKRKLNFPYLPKGLKFIHKLNPNFIYTTSEDFSITHLPVHPMWQLNERLISINEFIFKTISDTSGHKPYPFIQKINTYSNQHPTEQILTIAEDGYEFNSKNNFLKGTKYFDYSLIKWFDASTKTKSSSTILSLSNEVKKYTTQSEIYLKRFLNDNKKINNIISDSLTRKNREVLSFTSRITNNSHSQGNNLKRKIIINNRQNILIKLSDISKENDRARRANSEEIYQINRTQKQGNIETIKKLKSKIDSTNQELIELENKFLSYQKNIDTYRLNRSSIWDSTLNYEIGKIELIKTATIVDLENNNIIELREIHKEIEQSDKQIANLQARLLKADGLFNSKIAYKRDSIIAQAMRKIAYNKRLIVLLKKINQDNLNEDEEFIQQNTILHKWYNEISANNSMKIALRNEDNGYSKSWMKILKRERKSLRKYVQFENYVYNRWMGNETLRFKKFDSMAKNLIRHCQLLKLLTDQLIQHNQRK